MTGQETFATTPAASISRQRRPGTHFPALTKVRAAELRVAMQELRLVERGAEAAADWLRRLEERPLR